jgi:hypothetical protein
MRLRIAIIVPILIGLCFSFACNNTADVQEAKIAQVAKAEDPILTVLNPLGTPPPIKLKAMAPRLDTIKGKTIYIVNDGYPGSGILLGELTSVMIEKYPDTKFIYRDKPGGMGSEDAALWDEMGQKADAMIIALGH